MFENLKGNNMKSKLLLIALLFSALSFAQQSKNFDKGLKLFADQKYAKAAKVFHKDFKKTSFYNSQVMEAMCYTNLGNLEKSKNLYLNTLAINYFGKGRYIALVSLAEVYEHLENQDSALYYLDMAISEQKNEDVAYFVKGKLMNDLSKFDEALVCYEKCIELKPKNWVYYRHRLDVYLRLEQYDVALEQIEKLRKLNPDEHQEINLAFCYSNLERYAEADSVFQLCFNEKDPYFLNNFGMNKFHMGNTADAVQLIEQSLSVWSENSYAYYNLAQIYVAEGDLEKACEFMAKAQELGFEEDFGSNVKDLQNEHCSN